MPVKAVGSPTITFFALPTLEPFNQAFQGKPGARAYSSAMVLGL